MDFLEKIINEKKQEVNLMPLETVQPLRETYSFYQQVKDHPEKMHIIGEVKRASPSKGAINLSVNVIEQAKAYEQAGVTAISVLTDEVFFKGSIEDLRQVTSEVNIPVLCKDFIIDEKQLIRARNAGATIILLIVSALSKQKLEELYKKATALGLEVLVEVHDKEELRVAEALSAQLIGVNNRNLKTFDVSIGVSQILGEKQKTDAIYISESGFSTSEQVVLVKENYQAVLVGEGLMRESDPKAKVKALQVLR
ncbi:indole-3-glycerol phosphate synthase TrpC [Candidatus Enterococcus ikei]|uniref:Indole-3-glycerol phosphate synthase n=1 Tax=Candidatus Enterococcus ikei TaxID=2815326 RepID=A0ABS3H0X7_9ENTE|nr:indole-3-glycerol phosphate synthase TrpC [Enterococcus sp. DIV0869a]MBO0441157.1 indole-3-glycerol phosphate synthase TrpC [Enterococcus sp. DIV0869a]